MGLGCGLLGWSLCVWRGIGRFCRSRFSWTFPSLLVVGGWWLVGGTSRWYSKVGGGGGLVVFLMRLVWLGLAGILVGWLGGRGFYARGVAGWMRCGWDMVIPQ